MSKLLTGWRGVAALAAEHDRVVGCARTRTARKISSEVSTCSCGLHVCVHACVWTTFK